MCKSVAGKLFWKPFFVVVENLLTSWQQSNALTKKERREKKLVPGCTALRSTIQSFCSDRVKWLDGLPACLPTYLPTRSLFAHDKNGPQSLVRIYQPPASYCRGQKSGDSKEYKSTFCHKLILWMKQLFIANILITVTATTSWRISLSYFE